MLKSIASALLFPLNLPRSLLLLHRLPFSRRAKNSQLILHTPEQIENMITKKNSKLAVKAEIQKPWKTNLKDEIGKYRVSLVGLPNCGKSSLFNCLIGQRIAIVDKHRGTTRDRKQFNILDGVASIIDTPGVQTDLIKKSTSNKLKEEIFKQTITAIHESHLILFVVDIKKPVTSEEIEFAKYLKTFGSHARIVLVCNKCDNFFDEGEVINESSKLGVKEMFTVSSEQGTGVLELLNFINDAIPTHVKEAHEARRKQRLQRFEMLVSKLKEDIKSHNANKDFKIKEWENDFRKINPNPEENEDLDEDNFEDFLVKPEEGFSNTRGAEIKNIRMKNIIKICFIGRPNVGKSTLINQILGQEKMVVSQVAHTTRDSIRSQIQYKNRKIELIDTAGLNTPNIQENDEEYLRKVQVSTMLHVQESHVVVYLMDAFSSFVIDDFALIKKVIEQGRPVIIAINKWEAIKDPYRYKAKNYLAKQLEKHLGQLHGNPLVFISAKMGSGLEQMMDRIIVSYDKWNTRISTGLLNDWLDKFKKLQSLPKDHDHALKINYLIQARVRPPHFIFFVNSKNMFMSHYERFILRNLANEFKMDGIPLRLTLRSTNNRENKRVQPKERAQSKLKTRMEQLKKKYGNFGL